MAPVDAEIDALINSNQKDKAVTMARAELAKSRGKFGSKTEELAGWNRLIHTELRADRADAALVTANLALGRLRMQSNKKGEADMLLTIAQLQVVHKNYADAIKTARTALDYYQNTKDTRGEKATSLILASAVQGQGAGEKSAQQAAAKISAQNACPTEEFQPYNPSGVPPVIFIGGGFSSLIGARMFQKDGVPFVIYDRFGQLGGVWLTIANATSKVQIEHSTYSGLFLDNERPDHAGEFFPSRAMIAKYVQAVCLKYEFDKYSRVYTNVEKVLPKGDLYTARVRGVLNNETADVLCQGTIACPGFFPAPNRYSWPGEETFAGEICYGVCNDLEPQAFRGKAVTIIGTGAFAIENIRTSIECGAGKISQVARKRSLVTPRAVGYLSNMGPGCDMAEGLLMCNAMYKLMAYDSRDLPVLVKTPTGYIMNQRNSPCSDIYFLSQSAQFCQQYDEEPARVNRDEVVLPSGKRIETNIIIKSLGADLTSRNQLDDVFNLRKVYGFWVNADPAHMIYITSSRSYGVKGFGATSNIMPMMNCMCAYMHFRQAPQEFFDVYERLPGLTSLAEPAGILGTLGIIGQYPALGHRMQILTELKSVVTKLNYSYLEENNKDYKEYKEVLMPGIPGY